MRYKTILIIAVLLLFWQAASALNLFSTLFIAPPSEIFLSLIDLIASGKIWGDVFATSWRTVVAFLVSVFIGTPLGISIGYFRWLRESSSFLLDFLRSLPAPALFPLFILFFGIGDAPKIAVSAFIGTMVITVAAMYGAKQIKKDRLILAKKIGLKGKKLFSKVLLPESLPSIFSGYRLAASFCLILVVVTEMFLGTKYGLGARLIDAQMLYSIPELFALIFIAGCIGYFLNLLFVFLEKKIIHWEGR